MFKHNSFGGLGFFLGISVLSSACGVGEIGDSGGAPRLDLGFDDAALTCPGVSADLSASDDWQSKQASQPAPDSLYFEVMARPIEADLDSLVAIGAQDIQDFSDAAITVRFSETGLVDVMDDAEYSSDGLFEYEPGVWYNVAISADVSARTYDVEVGRCGEKRGTVIKGAKFRSAASVYDQLSNWGVWSSQRAGLQFSTPTWMTSGTCAPATCQALGAECGQPSDGCNGTLNCGVCGGGQLCSSGACVDQPESVPSPPSCTPASCQSLGAECGTPSDGCGGTLNCGGCPGQMCSNNVCVDQPVTPPPPPPACVPTTCEALGADCGVRSDGCGGTLNCGGCSAGQSCSDSLCIDEPVTPPPPPACVPATCEALGAECGARSDGCGGTLNCGGCGGGTPYCNPGTGQCEADPGFVFQDTIQTEAAWPWGFSDGTCHSPVDGDPDPTCADAQGVNISRVADPAGGGGYALRFYTELNGTGARAQLGVYGAWDATFNAAASSGNPFYCAMEQYIPSPNWYLNSGTGGWISLGDFHTLQPGGGGRYHTDPGFMINRGGTGTIQFEWNGISGNGYGSGYSSTAMPTDEWFDMEIGWQHSPNYDATVQLWMNGVLGLTQSNVRTAMSAASTETEFYVKQYGDDYDEVWNPGPQIRYVRNVRCSQSPITH